jgi:mono/diheme cytochrome c family protein
MRKLLIPVALAALCAVGCASEDELAARAAMVADGKAIAETQCAGCHAVGAHGESPARGAPPFRYVLERYSGATLNEDLIEGIRVNHAMPAFQFDPKGADALVVYLRTIQSNVPPDNPDRRRTP